VWPASSSSSRSSSSTGVSESGARRSCAHPREALVLHQAPHARIRSPTLLCVWIPSSCLRHRLPQLRGRAVAVAVHREPAVGEGRRGAWWGDVGSSSSTLEMTRLLRCSAAGCLSHNAAV
jgi:hypothetical protein